MSTSIAIFPARGFTPEPRLSPYENTLGIPVLSLDTHEAARLQFDPTDLDEAVRYLDEISDAANRLAARIRIEQSKWKSLLAAVDNAEATATGGAS